MSIDDLPTLKRIKVDNPTNRSYTVIMFDIGENLAVTIITLGLAAAMVTGAVLLGGC